MSLQTPRSGLQRPSFGKTNTASSPNLGASTSTVVNRKASLRALTGQPEPKTPASKMDAGELSVGDFVNVPGEMHGTVKFVGSVRGKAGTFVGVELAREFAARGKNDGDVDGTYYFTTSVPGSGIFLPVHRAEKRHSPSVSLDSFPPTPNTPSYGRSNGLKVKEDSFTPPTPAVPLKFSQSVGPGGRSSSPTFKPSRPSLPRPESPLRGNHPSLPPITPGRTLSQSQRGIRPGTTPAKQNFKASTSRPTTSHGQVPRPYSRTSSRQGSRVDAIEDDRTPVGTARTSNGSMPSFSQPLRPSSRLGGSEFHESEVSRLRLELAERDKRLAEQAANLADMEASVKELGALLPTDGPIPAGARKKIPSGDDDASAGQLRQMLREKNEKISMLTSEFDSHRADFRSTLDSLEMASTETERVYEEQKRELLAQVQELTERIQELEDLNQSKKEFDDVANQLKGLEEFVQELEEGLEDARRGEAEARGEVEFLRGEVERGRSELKRERDKAAASMGGNSAKELEQKDDEIRGLKAIIHSFSTNPGAAANGNGYSQGRDEVQRLQSSLEESQKEKERLEQELEQVRRDTAATNGHHRHASEMTEKAGLPGRSRGDTIKATFAEHSRRAGVGNHKISTENMPGMKAGPNGQTSSSSAKFCDMCESREHDTLDCVQFQGTHDASTDDEGSVLARETTVPPLSMATATTSDQIHYNSNKTGPAEERWCALCEKDGHLAYECPDEQ